MHYAIYKEYIALGYKHILVFEDDIVFLKNIKEIEKLTTIYQKIMIY